MLLAHQTFANANNKRKITAYYTLSISTKHKSFKEYLRNDHELESELDVVIASAIG